MNGTPLSCSSPTPKNRPELVSSHSLQVFGKHPDTKVLKWSEGVDRLGAPGRTGRSRPSVGLLGFTLAGSRNPHGWGCPAAPPPPAGASPPSFLGHPNPPTRAHAWQALTKPSVGGYISVPPGPHLHREEEDACPVRLTGLSWGKPRDTWPLSEGKGSGDHF